MREKIGVDLFSFPVIAITTNGYVKKNGECVMGRGCALTARDRYRGLASKLGSYLKAYGNRCFCLGKMTDGKMIFTFVVKHTWSDEADIELIKRSCIQLSEMLDKYNVTEIHIPRPGCGNGRLKWSDVKPIISELLDDRFVIVHK